MKKDSCLWWEEGKRDSWAGATRLRALQGIGPYQDWWSTFCEDRSYRCVVEVTIPSQSYSENNKYYI